MKITCIVGLPGSGKTHLANQIADKADAIQFDDISRLDVLEKCVKDGRKDIVITDPHFCLEGTRKSAEEHLRGWNEAPNSVEWLFFENDPETCWENVQRRADDRKISRDSVKFFSHIYKIPDNAETLPVWSIEKD